MFRATGCLIVAMIFSATPVKAELSFDLAGYQRPDGAITTHYNGDYVDPYFAAKALLIAARMGLDVQSQSKAWIEWAIRRQSASGLFSRFCIRENAYVPCQTADADDASLAVWLQLLTTANSPEPMPTAWYASWHKAEGYLTSLLYDSRRGLYTISRAQKVSLLMDNLEVYEALTQISAYYARLGDRDRGRRAAAQAANLKEHIIRQFWDATNRRFAVSTQSLSGNEFYPAQVAQLYPIITGMVIPVSSIHEYVTQWLHVNKAAWFANAKADYPWGMLLLAMSTLEKNNVAEDWVQQVKSLRHGEHWNVLEEAVWQGVTRQKR